MIKSYRIAILLISVSVIWCSSTAELSAHPLSWQPQNNFIDQFSSASLEDFREIDNILHLLNEQGFTLKEIPEVTEVGEAFYNKFKDQFEDIYDRAGDILSNPPQTFSRDLLENPDLQGPGINFRFSRNIARAFHAVAYYHFFQQEYDKAVKVLMLTQWFSHSISRGGEYIPLLIDQMISLAIRNIAVNETMWSALAAGNFSERWLVLVGRMMSQLEENQPSFTEVLEWALTVTLKTTIDEMLNTASQPDSHLSHPLVTGKITDMVESIHEHMHDVNKYILNITTAYRLNPSKIPQKVTNLVELLNLQGDFKITEALDFPRAMSRVLISISMPNFSRAYDQYLAARYREKGTILLVRFLKLHNTKNPLPRSTEDFRQVVNTNLPLDLYAPPRTTCRLRVCNDWMTLYSIGRNQTDNSGCQREDKILFKVPIKYLKK